MSGRLVILPKKTYTPWNPANVERVLRDERIAREKLEKERNKVENRNPLLEKREKEKSNDNSLHLPQHVNLFEKEEKAASQRIDDVVLGKSGGNAVGIMPVMLGGEESANKKKGKIPFYLTVTNPSQNCSLDHTSESNLKLKLDPMGAFTVSTSRKNYTTFVHNKEGPLHNQNLENNTKLSDSDNSIHSQKRKRRKKHKSQKHRKKHSSSRRLHSKQSRRDKEERSSRHRKSSRGNNNNNLREERNNNETKASKIKVDIEELRRRRNEREQNEERREKELVIRAGAAKGDRDRPYQNQYFPHLKSIQN